MGNCISSTVLTKEEEKTREQEYQRAELIKNICSLKVIKAIKRKKEFNNRMIQIRFLLSGCIFLLDDNSLLKNNLKEPLRKFLLTLFDGLDNLMLMHIFRSFEGPHFLDNTVFGYSIKNWDTINILVDVLREKIYWFMLL